MEDRQKPGTEQLSHKASKRAGFVFVLFGILIGFVLVEMFAHAYVTFIEPLRNPWVGSVPDPRLGVRPARTDPGIDARGWRDAAALASADIVVLGDSFEYGYWVSSRAAWPHRLGQLLHRPVYQMAMGSYGPGHYLLLFDEAAALRPRVIVAAYYLGNDIWDAYSLAYHIGEFAYTTPSAPLQALVSTDPKVREAIRAAEAIDPELLRYPYVTCGDRRPIPDPHLQQVHDILTAPPLAPMVTVKDVPAAAPPSAISPIRLRIRSLVNTSMAYRLVRRSLDQAAQRLFSPPHQDYGPPLCIHFQDGRLKTVFETGARLLALDTTDPRIVEGERISMLAYQALAERCRRAGIRFYVVIIPTKETAFRRQAEPLVGHEPYLRNLWDAEAAAHSRALAFFSRAHVDTIETLAALQAPIAGGRNPYREDGDDHPLTLGHEAIARTVAERLQRDGFGPLH